VSYTTLLLHYSLFVIHYETQFSTDCYSLVSMDDVNSWHNRTNYALSSCAKGRHKM